MDPIVHAHLSVRAQNRIFSTAARWHVAPPAPSRFHHTSLHAMYHNNNTSLWSTTYLYSSSRPRQRGIPSRSAAARGGGGAIRRRFHYIHQNKSCPSREPEPFPILSVVQLQKRICHQREAPCRREQIKREQGRAQTRLAPGHGSGERKLGVFKSLRLPKSTRVAPQSVSTSFVHIYRMLTVISSVHSVSEVRLIRTCRNASHCFPREPRP